MEGTPMKTHLKNLLFAKKKLLDINNVELPMGI
jgi:hypothetical protein